MARCRESRDDRDHRAGADLLPSRCARRRRCGETGVPDVARDASGAARASPLHAQGADGGSLRGVGAHHRAGARKDHRGCAGRDEARHRERRGRGRHPHADAGVRVGEHRQRHRRRGRASAHRRIRRHLPVQLPAHGAQLVHSLRHRYRQHRSREAVGAGAAVADADGGS